MGSEDITVVSELTNYHCASLSCVKFTEHTNDLIGANKVLKLITYKNESNEVQRLFVIKINVNVQDYI